MRNNRQKMCRDKLVRLDPVLRLILIMRRVKQARWEVIQTWSLKIMHACVHYNCVLFYKMGAIFCGGLRACVLCNKVVGMMLCRGNQYKAHESERRMTTVVRDQWRCLHFALSSGEALDGCAVVVVVQTCIAYQYARIDVHDRCRCVLVRASVANRFLAEENVFQYKHAMCNRVWHTQICICLEEHL